MKTIWLLPLLLATAACVSNGSVISDQPGLADWFNTPGAPFPGATSTAPAIPAAPISAPAQGLQIVQPATGGTPIFGMPLGGNLFLPATGGPPVFGMSLGQ